MINHFLLFEAIGKKLRDEENQHSIQKNFFVGQICTTKKINDGFFFKCSIVFTVFSSQDDSLRRSNKCSKVKRPNNKANSLKSLQMKIF